MEKETKMPYYAFLDRLRIAAACAVVMLHTITGVMDNTDMSAFPVQRRVFLVGMDLTTWCVPIFLVISGYLFLNPKRELSFRTMLLKYCRRIVLALFLFGIPFSCIELAAVEKGLRIGMLWDAVKMVLTGKSWAHLWYLYLIFFLYLVTPLLKLLLKRMPLWSVYLAEGVLFAGSSLAVFFNKLLNVDSIPVLPESGIYLFYYVYGYLLVRGDRECAVGRRQRGLISAAVLLLCAGMVWSRMGDVYSVQMAYNYPPTVLLTLLLAWLAQEREKARAGQRENRWSRRMSELSFTVYLIHPVFLNISYKFLHLTPLDFPLWLSLPVFYMAVLLLSAAGAYVLWKIPLLRKYVL